MVYTLSYSNIHSSEIDLVGRRAFLLSLGSRKVNSEIFFVLTSASFRKFLSFNSLESKIFDLFKTGIDESYFWDGIKSLFLDSVFPDDVLLELRESYDALSVSKSDAGNILRSFEARVNVILSSDFDCDYDGVFLNIRGFDNLVNAVKSCWFYSLKRDGFSSLKKGVINSSLGVIVQKFLGADFSLEVLVNSDSLFVNSYKGLPEVSRGIVKDHHVLSFNHLEFLNYELNAQNFSILHQDESGVLLKKRLGREGSDNKLSKQLISECCRLAKKVVASVDCFVSAMFVIKKDVPFLFLVNPLNDDLKSEVEDDVIVTDDSIIIGEDSFVDEVFVDNNYITESLDDSSSDSSDGFVSSAKSSDFVNSKKEPSIFLDDSSSDSSDIVSSSDSSAVVSSSDSSAVVSSAKSSLPEFRQEPVVSLDGSSIVSSDGFVDSDEFIIQEGVSGKDKDIFSLLANSFSLLEDFILRKYKESFGFAPNSFEDAIYELDSKHGFEDKSKILRVLEIKDSLLNGESLNDDVVFATLGFIEDFLKRND